MSLPQSDTREAGTWKACKDALPEHLKHLQRRFATLVCPVCGQMMAIGVGAHHITKEGVVSPSVVCPRKGCTFHEFIVLKGWS